jgi:hypothetical protein
MRASCAALSEGRVTMTRRIPSTKEILAWRVLNRSINESWVDWAVSMLQAGHDTLHLAILAGETEPFNQFAIVAIVDKALAELGCDWSDKETVIRDHVAELLHQVLAHQIASRNALRVLADMCLELDYPSYLLDFYYLYFAQDDLRTLEIQWYWPGATRENIEETIHQYATEWLQRNRP